MIIIIVVYACFPLESPWEDVVHSYKKVKNKNKLEILGTIYLFFQSYRSMILIYNVIFYYTILLQNIRF